MSKETEDKLSRINKLFETVPGLSTVGNPKTLAELEDRTCELVESNFRTVGKAMPLRTLQPKIKYACARLEVDPDEMLRKLTQARRLYAVSPEGAGNVLFSQAHVTYIHDRVDADLKSPRTETWFENCFTKLLNANALRALSREKQAEEVFQQYLSDVGYIASRARD